MGEGAQEKGEVAMLGKEECTRGRVEQCGKREVSALGLG